ncbi:MAG: 50S ribosomal protein L13 [Dehalococcoidia bacterium]|nr:MAG: 50S ribosomal protein L13 [Dehalococcoidia bacterium]
MKTYSIKSSEIRRDRHTIDAKGKVLGRLAAEVARLLMGKHKATFSRHMDNGDFVIVINAEKVIVSGNKKKQKLYYRHSGYPGGLKSTTLEAVLKLKPERVIENAVKGMLPKNRLKKNIIKKLKVYARDINPHLTPTGDSK